MGLAAALKRKLGGGSDGQAKRTCVAANGSAAPASASEAVRQRLANGGFAALAASYSSKNTRTALRKQRKAEAAARQAEQERQRKEAEEAARREWLGLPVRSGAGSDSEEEEAEAGAGSAATLHVAAAGGEEELGGGQKPGGGAAYSRLLGSLQSGGGAFASALQQRQREQAGDSDASESEQEEDELGSEEEGEEELGSGEEGEDQLLGSDEDAELGSGSEDEEAAAVEEEEEVEAAAEDAEDGSSSEDEEAAEQQQGRRQHLSEGVADAGAVAPTAAPEDHYLEHFDCQLSEERAAALLDESRRTRYLDCRAAGAAAAAPSGGSQGGEQGPAVAGDVLRQWPHAALQAAEDTRLPQAAPSDLAAYGVKERLIGRWREVAGPPPGAAANGAASASAGGSGKGSRKSCSKDVGSSSGGGACGDFVSGQQRALFALLSCYPDLLLPCRPYPASKDPGAADPQLDAVLLHMLSHCAKAADRIKKNNDRLRSAAGGDTPALDAVPKDQGFTRAKVLVLLPTRNLALRLVTRLLALAVKETRTDTIQNKQRFLEEFGDADDELTERERAAVARKPAEHQALFGGNTDDHFRLGIKLTRGAVKLFADFFDSDIIVASPLALATRLAEMAGDDSAADFLSSVEILVAERADVLLMQNWAHVVTVFEALNRIPRDGHGVDMMRVRDWALGGRASLYRQTILLSSFPSAEMNALLGRTCRNHAGKVRVWPTHRGVLGQIIPQARQVFERLPAPADGGALVTDPDARFEHFKRALWPRIKEAGAGGGTLIYLPSYFDYVRVRNFLREEMASFLGLCEYTDRSDAARARSYFFDRRKQVLLYTERAQFYNRHRIRGAKSILFYQLPEHPQFYAEVLNLLEEGEAGETPTVTVVFSKVDALRLERVVGSARATKMLKSKKTGTFLFC
ncbi:U3 small nucleolar RNA-associated 25 [Chlorella sorokiniana]|uniref:U3 small nucleolar RNA-associated 25 n=1 Tax=Chlorella sorokiniana TaxID=3076 RepID=A0A2P6TZ37_CHLSO|nr:U3 small nucleolar RNA-associated 25 [Chlorella sorokiniana]|eukprot:PRW59313.1 U3 small nucleolar RNA-associated 25 [Chlorella sorokiniana]